MKRITKEFFKFDEEEISTWIHFHDLITDIRSVTTQKNTLETIDLILSIMAAFESDTNIKDYF